MNKWHALSEGTIDALVVAGLDPSEVQGLVVAALEEDLDGGTDVTSVATIAPAQRSAMDLVAREPGVIAGIPVAAAVFEVAGGPATDVAAIWSDGDSIDAGGLVLQIVGRTRSLLLAERTALNLIGRLSGIATATAQWAERLSGTTARVRDTRKTTPGLRRLEKYAVRCGGGVNHRMSLSDAALVKDNHIAAIGGVVPAFEAVRKRFPGLPVEVEVDALDQLEEVLAAGADLVLLDNFSVEEMRQAVALNKGRARLEASGGLTVDDAEEVARTGVDFIAVGALTHSVRTLDIGADLSELAGGGAGVRGTDGGA